MPSSPIRIDLTPTLSVGDGCPLAVIAGPCVIESEDICRRTAETLAEVCSRLGLPYLFKASFDKANRTSVDSFRGPGLEAGLEILARVGERAGVPLLTDIHAPEQAAPAAQIVDVIQVPAFLCRQTDLLLAAAETGRPVNVKKGQFLAPRDMIPVVNKLRSGGCENPLVTERGSSFGYNNLVVDMRALIEMRETGAAVVFDATHSVQTPGGQGTSSGGRREFVRPLARAAAAVGINALFLECHPDPETALSDGPNSVPLSRIEALLKEIKAIHEID